MQKMQIPNWQMGPNIKLKQCATCHFIGKLENDERNTGMKIGMYEY